MDYQFPQQLFPSFYNRGPPDSVLRHSGGNWGCYDRVRPEGGPGPLPSWTFTSKHQVRGETWRNTEPVPVPLLSPKNCESLTAGFTSLGVIQVSDRKSCSTPSSALLWPSTPPDPLDFREHMQNFYMDHCQDAFSCMSEILGGHFKQGESKRDRWDSVHTWNVKNLQFKIFQQSYSSKLRDRFCALLADVVHNVPPELLGDLLYEELSEQRDRQLFFEAATGGALAFVPFSQSGGGSEHGCLLYPRNKGLNCLNFHRVELQQLRGSPPCVDASSSVPFSFQLKGPVRQISSASLFNNACIAVRSDHLCGVWRLSERNEPHLLQVINTREVATCISASPHVLGEVLVASESGAANLWTVGRRMQKVREEDSNLYFNAKSSWRWCEFSAHPRVILYADRTGVDLTDIRVSPASGHTLFSISSTSESRSGERLIMSKYLGDVHSFHHLITTQYSAYIIDERFPTVPMLKWDHMMQSPPMFCHVVLGGASSGGAGTTKVLLGSHSSQEITMLPYSGGRAEACSSRGPPQALLRPKDSLKHLPVQVPHRMDIAANRLSSPAAGLTCIQKKEGEGGKECICILQLTEAGDIFYQILEPDTFRPPAAEDDRLPQRAPKQPPLKEATASGRETAEQLHPDSQLVISDTSSDEDIIRPTQDPAAQRFVAETPERERRALNLNSNSSAEDSESERKVRNMKWLQVVVNDPELDQASRLNGSEQNSKVGKDDADITEESAGVQETVGSASGSELQTPVKLSNGSLVTWKHWLQKLMQKSRKNKPRPRRLQHFTLKTEGLCFSDDGARDATEEERVRSLSSDMRAHMSRRSLLVHNTVSASLQAPDVEPVPNSVDTEAWTDQLSRRLTISWEGEEAWRAWWVDKLGLNKKEKIEALKRKRRRQKEEKKAAGQRLELSGSFTSSINYQSEMYDFSDSTGWSSATSQGALSDADGSTSQLKAFVERGTPRAETPSTPQSVKDKQDDLQTPSSSRTWSLSQMPKADSTAGNQGRNKRSADIYLHSLFAPQDEPSQLDSYFLEEGSTVDPPPPPVVSSSSCQLHSSQPDPLRSLRVKYQDASQSSGFSQSMFLSQSSQGRLGLSPASQPKKKKSRMGF